MTTYSFIDESGETRLVGTISPAPGGGSQTVKRTVKTVTFEDIDAATGFAPMYLLPETETLLLCWAIVTEVFDGVDSGASPFVAATLTGPSGLAGGVSLYFDKDTFDATVDTAATQVVDGLMGNARLLPGETIPKNPNPVTAIPGGGSVQLLVDFAGGLAPVTPGSTGSMDIYLLLAVAP